MGGPDRKFVWKEGAKRGAPGWGSMTYYSSGVFNPLAGDWWDRTLHTEPLPQTETQEQWCWWANTMGLEELKRDQQETNLHGFSGGKKIGFVKFAVNQWLWSNIQLCKTKMQAVHDVSTMASRNENELLGRLLTRRHTMDQALSFTTVPHPQLCEEELNPKLGKCPIWQIPIPSHITLSLREGWPGFPWRSWKQT